MWLYESNTIIIKQEQLRRFHTITRYEWLQKSSLCKDPNLDTRRIWCTLQSTVNFNHICETNKQTSFWCSLGCFALSKVEIPSTLLWNRALYIFITRYFIQFLLFIYFFSLFGFNIFNVFYTFSNIVLIQYILYIFKYCINSMYFIYYQILY